jgi:peptidoglycan/xylan/chitin deacetylase (PgdA/CDA1 family)
MRLGKALKLAGLAFVGLCTVSIPITLAVVFSATGTSDLLTIGGGGTKRDHQTPARAVASLRCQAKRGYYALSFVDGPSPRTTPRLVAKLKRANAVATFFDVGERAAAHRDLVELQRSVGHVANHGYSHARMPALSQARRVQELQATARILDYPNVLFLPPFGQTSRETDGDIRRTGLTPVYGTVSAGHGPLTTATIIERAVRVRPGGIVLLEDGAPRSADAVAGIVGGLAKRGMCPGFIGPTRKTVVASNGARFHAAAVKP